MERDIRVGIVGPSGLVIGRSRGAHDVVVERPGHRWMQARHLLAPDDSCRLFVQREGKCRGVEDRLIILGSKLH